jgi:hypothetical protein
MALLAGSDDEALYAERYEALFADAGRPIPVTLLSGVGHVGMTLEPPALAAVVAAVQHFEHQSKADGGTP